MTIIARRFRARPFRTAHETWIRIRDTICHSNAEAKTEFDFVAGNASSLISDEALKDDPMIVVGSGSRLRVYCIYDDDAISGEDQNEGLLSWNPLSSDWAIHLPCPKEDLLWMKKQLKEKSTRFFVYDATVGYESEDEQVEKTIDDFSIDAEGFRNL